MSTSHLTRSARLAVVACLGLTLSGCTVEAGSKIGLGVAPDGHLLAVVAVCEGYLDGMTVYSGEGPTEREDGRWQHKGRINADTTLDLNAPGDEWTTEKPLALDASRRQSVYGWTKANRWSATGLDFTSADLQKLSSGQVWFERLRHDQRDFERVFVPMASFHDAVCSPD